VTYSITRKWCPHCGALLTAYESPAPHKYCENCGWDDTGLTEPTKISNYSPSKGPSDGTTFNPGVPGEVGSALSESERRFYAERYGTGNPNRTPDVCEFMNGAPGQRAETVGEDFEYDDGAERDDYVGDRFRNEKRLATPELPNIADPDPDDDSVCVHCGEWTTDHPGFDRRACPACDLGWH
jgi:hypothetical protein